MTERFPNISNETVYPIEEIKPKRIDVASHFLNYGLDLLRPFLPDEKTLSKLENDPKINEDHVIGLFNKFSWSKGFLNNQPNGYKLYKLHSQYNKINFIKDGKFFRRNLFIEAILMIVNNEDKKIQLPKSALATVLGYQQSVNLEQAKVAFCTDKRLAIIESYILAEELKLLKC